MIPVQPAQLQYDRPLSLNEVRVERSQDGVRIVIGPRTAWQVLVSLDLNIYVMLAMALACMAGIAFAGLRLFDSQSAGDAFGDLVRTCIALGTCAVCLGAAIWPAYRRRLARTILTVSKTDLGIDPADDRSTTIWVPRARVISVAMVRLRFRPFAGDAQTLHVGLTGAPPVITLSGYPSGVVQPIVDELIAVLALLAREESRKNVAAAAAEPVDQPYFPLRKGWSPYTPIEAAPVFRRVTGRVQVDHGIATRLLAGPPTRRQLAAILWTPVAATIALVCIDLYCLAAPALYPHMMESDREFVSFAAPTVGIMALLAAGGVVLAYKLAKRPLTVIVSSRQVIVPRLGLLRSTIGLERYRIGQVCAGVRHPPAFLGLNLPPKYVLMIRFDGMAWLHALPGGDGDTLIELAEHLRCALASRPTDSAGGVAL